MTVAGSVGAQSPQANRENRSLLLQSFFKLARVRKLSTLIFHRVLSEADPLRPNEPTAAEFDARMAWIAANFNVLSLGQAAMALKRGTVPERALCITFDDGYADNHDLALPILRKYGLPATFFIATGYLDGGCMFNDVIIEAVRQAPGPLLELNAVELGVHRLATVEERRAAIRNVLEQVKHLSVGARQDVARRVAEICGAAVPANLMATSDQVAAMHRAGMEIGGHTVQHPILASIDLEQGRNEIARGRRYLEEITGGSIRVFAYPNGRPLRDYRREHVELIRSAGFDAAVSTAQGAAAAGADLFQIPRFTPWDKDDLRFGLRLARNVLSADYARA